ncbi:MAG: conjugal transfer protein TraX [Oscillospiraceae bacterium]|nr:conjugal transfer protein TraX [Oscillospiraceae bacterium]
MNKGKNIEITSAGLHIMAMVFMLCDHLWGTVVPGNDWLTCIGRISFPIFAFMIVEGYFHTGNLKKYVKRLFLFALISEIPFNLAMGSRLFYPVHQNVLWSFLMAIGFIHWNEKARKSGKKWKMALTAVISVILAYLLGIITMVDFYHAGVLTVLVFYFFRNRKWYNYMAQFICLWYINMEILGGYSYQLNILGQTYFVARQGFALLALIPIWLYRGRQGYHTKAFQHFCYWFYPVHLLVLGLLKFVL